MKYLLFGAAIAVGLMVWGIASAGHNDFGPRTEFAFAGVTEEVYPRQEVRVPVIELLFAEGVEIEGLDQPYFFNVTCSVIGGPGACYLTFLDDEEARIAWVGAPSPRAMSWQASVWGATYAQPDTGDRPR